MESNWLEKETYNQWDVNNPKYSFLFEQPWEVSRSCGEFNDATSSTVIDDPLKDYEDFYQNSDLISLIDINPDLFYRLERSGELGAIPIKVKYKWSIKKVKKDQLERLVQVLCRIKELKKVE